MNEDRLEAALDALVSAADTFERVDAKLDRLMAVSASVSSELMQLREHVMRDVSRLGGRVHGLEIRTHAIESRVRDTDPAPPPSHGSNGAS